MKRKFLIMVVLVLSILTSTACRKMDSADVKDIEKTKSEYSTVQNQGNVSNKSNDNSSNNNNISSLNSSSNEKGEIQQADTEENIKKIINDRAIEVITAIKEYDMNKLSKTVHPDKGVRFTPYAFVDSSKNLVFSADEIKNMGENTKKYIWGSYDGSGEPIELTFSDYYKKFIYDADFINAKEIGYNKTLGKGNSINNSFDFYKNSIIVEYYFPGFDPQYNGIDWKSIRLVFEKMDDTWYIVGIIHDQWTI